MNYHYSDSENCRHENFHIHDIVLIVLFKIQGDFSFLNIMMYVSYSNCSCINAQYYLHAFDGDTDKEKL